MIFRKVDDGIMVEFPELPGAKPVYFTGQARNDAFKCLEVDEDEVHSIGNGAGISAVDVDV
jgi:hypothetical protein